MYKGIRQIEDGSWVASTLTKKGYRIYVGFFETPEDAYEVYLRNRKVKAEIDLKSRIDYYNEQILSGKKSKVARRRTAHHFDLTMGMVSDNLYVHAKAQGLHVEHPKLMVRLPTKKRVVYNLANVLKDVEGFMSLGMSPTEMSKKVAEIHGLKWHRVYNLYYQYRVT